MPVRRTQSWLPSIFNDFFDNDWMVKANATAPAINVLETEKEYKVELAAPGMTKDDFNVRIDEDNNLVISMEKKTENKEEKKDGRYLRRECCSPETVIRSNKTALSLKGKRAVFILLSLVILPITNHCPTIKHYCKKQQYSKLWQ